MLAASLHDETIGAEVKSKLGGHTQGFSMGSSVSESAEVFTLAGREYVASVNC